MKTGIEVIQKFASGRDKACDGILAFCKHRSTSAIEAFNATIGRVAEQDRRSLVCRAGGYRDLAYLYLKIRQEALKC